MYPFTWSSRKFSIDTIFISTSRLFLYLVILSKYDELLQWTFVFISSFNNSSKQIIVNIVFDCTLTHTCARTHTHIH